LYSCVITHVIDMAVPHCLLLMYSANHSRDWLAGSRISHSGLVTSAVLKVRHQTAADVLSQEAVRAQREQLQQQLLHLHHLLRQGWLKSRPPILERRAKQCCMMQKAHCFSSMTRKPRLGESVAVASSESIKPLTVEALAVQCVRLRVWRCLPKSGLPELKCKWVKCLCLHSSLARMSLCACDMCLSHQCFQKDNNHTSADPDLGLLLHM
jgi:hypothetical protein